MSKTEIILFIIDQLVLKLWNVSSKMRKRVKWILKGMELTLTKYDSRIFSLTKWVKFMRKEIYIESLSEIKKGVSNYIIVNQTKLAALLSLNQEIRCFTIALKPDEPILVHHVDYLAVTKGNYNDFKHYSFIRVVHLHMKRLDSVQTRQILAQIDSVSEISFCGMKIANLNRKNISKFSFNCVELKGK